VFVGGISWKATEEGLANFFSTYGKVIECKIIMDKNTGKSKGYGFVTFADPEQAAQVKQSTKLSYMGKMMNVGDAVRKNDFTKGQIDYQFPPPVVFTPYEYNYNQFNSVPQYFGNSFVQFVPPMFYGNGFVPPAFGQDQPTTTLWYPPNPTDENGTESNSLPELHQQEVNGVSPSNLTNEVASQREQVIQ